MNKYGGLDTKSNFNFIEKADGLKIFKIFQIDTTAERDKFRFKMQDAYTKANHLIALINGQSPYKITEEMFSVGFFPWNETAESKFFEEELIAL